jgi:hypothetical protein
MEVKTGILPKEINANRFFWDSHGLEIRKHLQLCPSIEQLRDRGYGLRHDKGLATEYQRKVHVYVQFALFIFEGGRLL